MKIFKTRKYYYAVVVVLFIAGFVLIAYPTDEYSLASMVNSTMKHRELAAEQENNKNKINNLSEKLGNIKTNREKLGSYYEKVRRKTTKGAWEMHEPSMLVYLEQNAEFFGLDITINYDAIEDRPGEIDEFGRKHVVPVKVQGNYMPLGEFLYFVEQTDFYEIKKVTLSGDERIEADLKISLLRV